ncbi:GHMP kinase [Streptomyces sp. NPDC051561]|uniref:GHMP family kinase ATP-binding protein n=1 Tax=Streptomyces sp. NPDC051561 TaxID=3365658 RepID=UPI00379F2197
MDSSRTPEGSAHTPPGPRIGAGHAACHHGEILQGVFRDATGRACAGLVTLPVYDGPGSRAVFVPRPGGAPGVVTVCPADRTKARRAAELAVEECARRTHVPLSGGELTLGGNLPVGLGMGSSSSDVLAALRAVADAFGVHLSPGTLASLAVLAEGASDPLMLDGRPVLFAQREGRVLEVFGGALPPVVVVGCTLGGGRPVDTLALADSAPAGADRTTGAELGEYARLRGLLRRAVREADPVLLGQVATGSARLGQRRLPQPEFSALVEVAGRVGAVGVQVAHSGNVAGLLLDPAGGGLPRRVRSCVRALEALGLPAGRVFTTYGPTAPPAAPPSGAGRALRSRNEPFPCPVTSPQRGALPWIRT